MEDILSNKIKDYCGYALRAVDNFKKGHYLDCAINCRRAAEAACKIIYYHSYNKKRAEDKTTGKLLGDLISQAKKDSIIAPKAINILETIQSKGNAGAHDNPVTKAEAAYVLHALDLLTVYLFKNDLKIPIPGNLNFDTETKEKPVQPEIIKEIIIQEKTDARKEAEMLEKLAVIERDNAQLKQHVTEKLKELSDAKDIKKDEILVEEIQVTSNPQNKFRSQKNKAFYIVLGSLIVFLSLTWLYLNKKNETAVPSFKKSDTLFVAVNSLQVLQDNPNINFKIETVLKSYIEAKALKDHLTIQTIPTDFTGLDMNSDTSIIRFAQLHGFYAVYFGNLYETALGDSNVLEIKGALSGGDHLFRNKKIKFKSLADSTFIKEMNDQANLSVYAYCDGRFKGKEIKKGIKILEQVKSYSDESYAVLKGRLARFLYLDRDYGAVISVNHSILLKYPNTAFYFDRISRAYMELGQLDSAEIYARMAYSADSTHSVFSYNYASVLATRKKYNEARPILESMIKKDPKNMDASALLKFIGSAPSDFFVMGKEMSIVLAQADTLMSLHNYKHALNLYLKANRLDPENMTIQFKTALCYLLTSDTANAYLSVNKILKKDSLHQNGLYLLTYMDGYSSRGVSSAVKNYERAVRLYPKNIDLLENYVNYLMRKRRYKQCRDICAQALASNSSNVVLNTAMAYACLSLQDYRSARDKFEWLCLVQPSDTNMIYLSECYLGLSKGPKSPEFTKGFQLIQKALSINKNNSIATGIYVRYITAARNPG